MGRSDYVTREGHRYDKQLVHMVEKWFKEDGKSTINKADASALWECAKDGDKISERERETLRYVLKKYKFAGDAAEHLSKLVDPPASGTSELITVDGKQLLRKLWDEAMKFSQDGSIDVDEMRDLWKTFGVADGETCGDVVALTFYVILDKIKCSPNCRNFIEPKLPKYEQLVGDSKPEAEASAPVAAALPDDDENDEFIALVKQWTKDELANDDFFSKVSKYLPQ